MIVFKFYTRETFETRRKIQIIFQDDSSKNLYTGKVWNKPQGKVSIFEHQRKLRNLGNHPKQVSSTRNSLIKEIIKVLIFLAME